jgi:hypothetical protein
MTALLCVLLMLSMTMVSCTTAGTIEEIVTLADVAVSAIAAVEPNVPGVAIAAKYITAVGQGLDCAIAERQSTDTPAVQAAKITSCVAAAVLPELPAGTPTTIVTILNQVAQAIAKYLSNMGVALHSGAALSRYDGGKLPAMHVQVTAIRARIPQR